MPGMHPQRTDPTLTEVFGPHRLLAPAENLQYLGAWVYCPYLAPDESARSELLVLRARTMPATKATMAMVRPEPMPIIMAIMIV